MSRKPLMTQTAISESIRQEIQRFESVHPNIFNIHEIINDVAPLQLQEQIREQLYAIEDAFVNSQEWTLGRCVKTLRLGIVGTQKSGRSSLVHHYLTGMCVQEEAFEGGRFKKEVVVDGRSYMLLIREEGGMPDAQFSQWIDGVMLVYNTADETSFRSIYSMYAKMAVHRSMQNLPIFLVACRGSVANDANDNKSFGNDLEGSHNDPWLRNNGVCNGVHNNENYASTFNTHNNIPQNNPNNGSFSAYNNKTPQKHGVFQNMKDTKSLGNDVKIKDIENKDKDTWEEKGRKMARELKSSSFTEVRVQTGYNVQHLFSTACRKLLSTKSNSSLSPVHHSSPPQQLSSLQPSSLQPTPQQPQSLSSAAVFEKNKSIAQKNDSLSKTYKSLDYSNNDDIENSIINNGDNKFKITNNRVNNHQNVNINRGISQYNSINHVPKNNNDNHSNNMNNNNTNIRNNSSKSKNTRNLHRLSCDVDNFDKSNSTYSVNENNINNNIKNNIHNKNNFNNQNIFNNNYNLANNFPNTTHHQPLLNHNKQYHFTQVTNPSYASSSPPSSPHNNFDPFVKNSFKSSSFHERIDSFLRDFSKEKAPLTHTTSHNITNNNNKYYIKNKNSNNKTIKGGFFSKHRSYSIQSIEQGDDDTPQSTPVTVRKIKRRSNIFHMKKDQDDKKKTDSKLGSGRSIPVKQGWLYKRSNKTLSREWSKKYVVLLSVGKLLYYHSLNDYMENTHAKEIELGHSTVKIPGQGPRGSQIPTPRMSKHEHASNNNSDDATTDIIISNSGVTNILPANNIALDPDSHHNNNTNNLHISNSVKTETPLTKRKHRRVKSSSKSLDPTMTEGTDGGYEFVIVSLNNKQCLFEAGTLEEREEWVSSIEQQILKSLQDNCTSKNTQCNVALTSSLRQVEGNDVCADCSSPDPVWASLEHGALICIECSGVHRKLGSHVSRVRSLQLDEWPQTHVEVMMALGNKACNDVWEANLIGFDKPLPNSDREHKERWIRDKYEFKKFIPPLPHHGEAIQRQLMDAVACNNIYNLITVLSHCDADDVNTPYNNTNDSRTALHIAAAFGKVVFVQLLLWHGADASQRDHEGHQAVFYAREHGALPCHQLLVQHANNQ